MIIYFDIETVQDGENVAEFNEAALIERYGEKFNFMPEFNRIFTIAVWTVTKEGNVIKNLEWSEEEQIRKFFDVVNTTYKVQENGRTVDKPVILCWFNIKGFDLPFIIKRALKYQIDIPNSIKFYGTKPWDLEHILDLQEVYKCGVFAAPGNLDLICNYLGITSPKSDWIDGSQVQEFYNKWELEKVKEYCRKDVEATIKVYKYFLEYNLI